MVVVMVVLSFLTFGLSGIVFAFIYNNMYVKYLIGEGFKAKAASTDISLLSKKVGQQIPTLEAI